MAALTSPAKALGLPLCASLITLAASDEVSATPRVDGMASCGVAGVGAGVTVTGGA